MSSKELVTPKVRREGQVVAPVAPATRRTAFARFASVAVVAASLARCAGEEMPATPASCDEATGTGCDAGSRRDASNDSPAPMNKDAGMTPVSDASVARDASVDAARPRDNSGNLLRNGTTLPSTEGECVQSGPSVAFDCAPSSNGNVYTLRNVNLANSLNVSFNDAEDGTRFGSHNVVFFGGVRNATGSLSVYATTRNENAEGVCALGSITNLNFPTNSTTFTYTVNVGTVKLARVEQPVRVTMTGVASSVDGTSVTAATVELQTIGGCVSANLQ